MYNYIKMLSTLEREIIILKLEFEVFFHDYLQEFNVIRKQFYPGEQYYLSNILIKLKWKNNFKGPRTLLLMYKNEAKQIFYETYLYFKKHKPSHLSLETFEYIKLESDVVRHYDIDTLIYDINIENELNTI